MLGNGLGTDTNSAGSRGEQEDRALGGQRQSLRQRGRASELGPALDAVEARARSAGRAR